MASTAAIINWNSGNRLRGCVKSLLESAADVEIVVIDNASKDASIDSVQEFRTRVSIVRNRTNRGFAAAVNQAFHATSTPYVLVLNPDLCATSQCVHVLEQFLDSNPKAAAVGGYVGDKYLPKMLPTIATLVRENLGARRPNARIDASSTPIQVEQPAAAALMIRRAAYDDVGGFDEQFYPAWYEDVDFCRRLKSHDWQIYFAPNAEFLHEGGYSADELGSSDFLRAYYENQVRYARKHFGIAGTVAVRLSIMAGMVARIIGRPKQAAAYGKTFVGALKGW